MTKKEIGGEVDQNLEHFPFKRAPRKKRTKNWKDNKKKKIKEV